MKPGFWYTLASYLLELPVEKRQSRYSGELAVTFHRGQYKLSSANAVYSFGKHYTSFAIPFRMLHVHELPLHEVLILGFGLGSVAVLLAGHPQVEQITAVDADDVVLDLAKKYLVPFREKIDFQCADAVEFLNSGSNRFDLIVSDIFIDDRTPVRMMQPEYLSALKERLAPEGLLLFSKLDMSNADHIENRQFEKHFRNIFPGAFTIQAEGNKLFCARG